MRTIIRVKTSCDKVDGYQMDNFIKKKYRLLIAQFIRFRLLAHCGCVRSTSEPDPTSGISRGPCLPCTHFCIFLFFRITRSITVRYLCSFVEFGNTEKQIAKPAYIDMEKHKPVSACGVFRSQQRHAGIILEGGWES